MPDIRTIIDDVTRLANTVSGVLPVAGAVGIVGGIAEKVLGIMDTLKEHPPTQDIASSQAAMQQARETLEARVRAHAESTSAALRGDE